MNLCLFFNYNFGLNQIWIQLFFCIKFNSFLRVTVYMCTDSCWSQMSFLHCWFYIRFLISFLSLLTSHYFSFFLCQLSFISVLKQDIYCIDIMLLLQLYPQIIPDLLTSAHLFCSFISSGVNLIRFDLNSHSLIFDKYVKLLFYTCKLQILFALGKLSKKNDETYGKFHLLGGGVRGRSFSMCYHERFLLHFKPF